VLPKEDFVPGRRVLIIYIDVNVAVFAFTSISFLTLHVNYNEQDIFLE
jgi:hypothetical protein